MPDLSVETSLPKGSLRKFSLNCAYYPGAKPGKKYALNKQYALLSQLRLLTRVYGICLLKGLFACETLNKYHILNVPCYQVIYVAIRCSFS